MKRLASSAFIFVFLVSGSLVMAGPGGPGQGKGNKPPQGERNPAEFFERLDKDGNGELSQKEIPEKMQERVARMDKDGSGTISRREFMAAVKNRPGSGKGPGKGPGQGQPGKGPKPGGKGTPTPAGFMKKFDTDNDGLVSRAEAPEKLAERFDKVDTNGDGGIDVSEIEAAMKRREENGGGGKQGPAKKSKV